MSEFYEFDEGRYRNKGKVKAYILIAVVFLLLGSFLTFALQPYLFARGAEEDKVAENTKGDDDIVLGAATNFDISQDNPVVDIAEKVGPAVVGITSTREVIVPDFFFYERTKEMDAYGSGIVISEEGYIVTNHHVVENATRLYVVLQGGEKIEAELVGSDPYSDVAVIKVEYDNLTVAPIGDSDKVRQGELAIAIGNPLGHNLAGTVTVGVISALDRNLKVDSKGTSLKLIQTDAAINQGNSGGALINSKGEVIGMNTAKLGGELVEGLGFAIPSNVFVPIVEKLIKNGQIKPPEKPWLGIFDPLDVTEELADEYGYPVGVLVRDVSPDGPSAIAGIRPGDIIIAFDGEEIKNTEKLQEMISAHKVGDVVKLTVWRNDMEFTLKVKLGNMPIAYN